MCRKKLSKSCRARLTPFCNDIITYFENCEILWLAVRQTFGKWAVIIKVWLSKVWSFIGRQNMYDSMSADLRLHIRAFQAFFVSGFHKYKLDLDISLLCSKFIFFVIVCVFQKLISYFLCLYILIQSLSTRVSFLVLNIFWTRSVIVSDYIQLHEWVDTW